MYQLRTQKNYKSKMTLRETEKAIKLLKDTFETMLEGEMDEHLGYEKHNAQGNNSGNSRNGHGHKTVKTEIGEVPISVPRDRNGEFEPQVIGKHQTRCAW